MIRRLCATLLLAVSFNGTALETEKVEAALKQLAPNAEIGGIAESAVPGLLEVMLNGQVLYMTADGRYLLQGMMFDVENRVDLTEKRMGLARRERLSEIPETQQITYAPENPVYTVQVFTDIDCGYCRRLHSQMEQYNELGIGVSYLFFPRAGLKSHSFDKAVSVWCAADPHDALTAAKAGEEPEPAQCDSPIESHYQLGRSVGVTGTPAIIAPDGTYISGYLPPDQLLARLEQLNVAGQTD